ncbi:SCO2322 family protein [Streptomyces sp. HD]|uniref:SCO2322 family protein n=1 Tax=Streptomyces sp. HD TaxID=3020892 RepID=UPI00232BFC00|nr:SCO2322 family protein [Streptomyces sp. HD]MDC0768262.1 SCO2322 family protein [Streptomyces sp. HD]
MIRRALATLLAALVLLTGAAQAAQATGYRYWSFWDRDGDTWAYATQGPSTARPSDGDVQGFRFAVSEDSKDAAQPRGAAVFEVICARTAAQDGRKRVALVIDFGTAADAPSGETPPARRTVCARVGEDATAAEALAAVAEPLRYDTNALLCAIADYPEKGCGEQVSGARKPTAAEESTTTEDQNADSDDGGPSLGLVAGIAVVTVLGAAGLWQARRRRDG